MPVRCAVASTVQTLSLHIGTKVEEPFQGCLLVPTLKAHRHVRTVVTPEYYFPGPIPCFLKADVASAGIDLEIDFFSFEYF